MIAWSTTTTETRFASSQVITEIDDLVLRMGRIAFTDPCWAPDKSKPVPKDPADLAGTAAEALDVLSAVHQAADALAAMASGDLAAIEVAAQAGRLFVPTRTLPEPMPAGRVGRYFPITPDRAEVLFQIYRTTIAASHAAGDTLAALAIEAKTPSRVLALARQASRTPSPDRGATEPEQARPRAIPYITEILHTIGNKDPGLFLRAAAIDRAGIEVVNQAREAAGLPPLASSAELRRLADPQNAAQLAAMDTGASRGAGRRMKRSNGNVQRRAG